CGLCTTNRREGQIRNQHSPIANLEHPSALSLAISRAAKLLIRLIVQGCSKLAIGECWLRIFGPSSSGAICCAKQRRGELLIAGMKDTEGRVRYWQRIL